MPKYEVFAHETACYTFVVEAATEEEALEIVRDPDFEVDNPPVVWEDFVGFTVESARLTDDDSTQT